jgi:tetratricopeptide (TPR) repeat protein
MKQGRKAEAEEMSRRAIAALEKLADLGPLEPPTREQHIRAYINLGWLLTSVPGRREDGIAAHQQAVLLAEKLAAGIPDAPRYRDLLAGACIDLGIVWRPTRPRDTEALLTRAITLLSETQGNGHYLGRAYLALGELCFEEERLPEAEQAFRRAKAIQETLVSASPQVWQLRERLGDTNLHLGRVLAATGRGEEAEQALREAVAICDQLRAEYPAVPIYRDSLAISQAALLMVLEPGTSSKEAEELAGKLQATQPDNVHAHARMAWALANGPEEKLRDSRRAVALARKAVEMDPERAVHWRALALAHYRVSEAREALAALDKARAQTGREDGFDLFLRALASWQLGEKEPSRRSLAAAVTWTQQHRPEDAELRRLRREAENLMGPVNP